MNLIKNYTLFANGVLHRVQFSTGDWSSCYVIDSIRLKNNNTNIDIAFTCESDKKLMKSLADTGYSKKLNKSKYDSISRRLRIFFKKTETEKTDWKHIVDNTGNVLKIWLTNIHYDRDSKRMFGETVLFRESCTNNKSEYLMYSTRITERYGRVDGRFHDFTKLGGYKSFTHHLEMEKIEMRTNTYIKNLRENATKKEIIEHSNHIAEVVNFNTDELQSLRAENERLQLLLAHKQQVA